MNYANLVVRPERLGDLVLATPVFRAFKETWPDVPVHVLSDDVYGQAIAQDPHVDRVISVRWKSQNSKDRVSFHEIYNRLRQTRYLSAAVLFANCPGLNWTLAAAGIRHVAQLGGTWPAVLLKHKMVLRGNHLSEQHYVDWYLEVARKLGATTKDKLPKLHVTLEERRSFLQRFPDWSVRKPKIIVHPFEPGSAPNFSRAAYLDLIATIRRNFSAEVFITGSSRDAASWNSMPKEGVREDFLGQLSIRELMCACENADLVIAGSTGVIHLAAGMGANTLGFYCPAPGANPSLWGPRGTGHSICLTPTNTFCKHLLTSNGACTGDRHCDLSLGIDSDSILSAIGQLLNTRHSHSTAC